MERDDELKEIDFKNLKCYYFDDIEDLKLKLKTLILITF